MKANASSRIKLNAQNQSKLDWKGDIYIFFVLELDYSATICSSDLNKICDVLSSEKSDIAVQVFTILSGKLQVYKGSANLTNTWRASSPEMKSMLVVC